MDIPNKEDSILVKTEVDDVKEKWLSVLSDLNVCSQKGLVEMFDGSIGAGSVFMPHGGKYQMTETQAMVAKLPVLTGKCDTVTMMSFGYDPYLSVDAAWKLSRNIHHRLLLQSPVVRTVRKVLQP